MLFHSKTQLKGGTLPADGPYPANSMEVSFF